MVFLLPFRSGLQVHAVDEVVRLLRVEGPGFLQLVADQPQAAANHEQQQSGDDEAQGERKDGACGTQRDKGKDAQLKRTARGHP